MNIYDIISQLEEEVGAAKAGIFHKKLDVNLVAGLVEDLKNNMPKAIEEASYILSQKDKILATAQTEAQAMLEDAGTKASNIVSESAIMKQAEEESKKLMDTTIKRCEQLLDTTKNNVDKILKAVEDYLAEHLSIVHDSRDELSSTLVKLKAILKKD